MMVIVDKQRFDSKSFSFLFSVQYCFQEEIVSRIVILVKKGGWKF
jgi:hypothetical protein